jgi:transcriptional regulator with XRE-family HTH domain
LLDITQPQLATLAGLGLSTIYDFEKERRVISDETLAAIRSALEKAGVIFQDENGEGPGVRLKKKKARSK